MITRKGKYKESNLSPTTHPFPSPPSHLPYNLLFILCSFVIFLSYIIYHYFNIPFLSSPFLHTSEPNSTNTTYKDIHNYTDNYIHPDIYSIIFASYFTQQLDVHYKRQVPDNNFGLIQRFYDSIQHTNLKAIIFHDNLSPKFVAKYTTPQISFEYVADSRLKPVALCSLRFFVYEEYLKKRGNYRYVLATDLFDVNLLKNPFKLFEDMREYYDIFIQKEEPASTWTWLSDRSVDCTGSRTIAQWPPMGDIFFNCGLIGGKTGAVLSFFHLINSITTNTSIITNPRNACCDMIATNHAIYTFMSVKEKSRIMTGYPFHSRFYSFGSDGSDSFVAHK